MPLKIGLAGLRRNIGAITHLGKGWTGKLVYDSGIGFYVDTTRGKRIINDGDEIEISSYPSSYSLRKYRVKL